MHLTLSILNEGYSACTFKTATLDTRECADERNESLILMEFVTEFERHKNNSGQAEIRGIAPMQ